MQEAGNQLLKQGREIRRKLVIGQAVEKYSEGLAILHAALAAPPALTTALYSNRAFAEGLLGNWRSSFESARWALKTDPKHVKSYIRAAKAAQELRKWPAALEVCAWGLAVEEAAPELLRMQAVRALLLSQLPWGVAVDG